MGPEGARVRRVKFSAPNVVEELELSAPVDTEAKTIKLDLPEQPESQEHGIQISDEEAKILEEIDRRSALYGAARGDIPSDFVT